MDEARKNAFRRILYAAMVDFRSHNPISPHAHFARTPWRVWKAARRLNEIQLLADWLHNLAFFASHDFEGFGESQFWGEWKRLVHRYPKLEGRHSVMRDMFERDWNPVTNKNEIRRQWGTRS